MELKISIVEDDWLVAQDLAEQISSLGYEVDLVLTPPEYVLLAIKNYSPDLVLMDINLQGKSGGIFLAEKIMVEYPLPFIFLTGNWEEQLDARLKNFPAQAYLEKPVGEGNLEKAIKLAVKNYYEQALNF